MFHSSLPRLLLSSVVFLYSVFPCLSHVLLYSCIKKELFFLLAVLQSVCLSVFVRLAIFLAVWLQVEKWGHSVGKLTGWIPDGWSSAPSRHGDLTGGVTHRCLYPLPPSVSVCLLLSSVCSPLYPPVRLWSLRLEKSFLFPFPPYFDSCLAPKSPLSSFLLVSDTSKCVCKKNACQLPTQPPSQITSVAIIIKAARWMHRPTFHCNFAASTTR